MEKLRRYLQIERWQVFGGSWGSTLVRCALVSFVMVSIIPYRLETVQSLAYAISHPASVLELIVQGIFLFRQRDVDFLYKVRRSCLLQTGKRVSRS
jgi:proline iminopeptidase